MLLHRRSVLVLLTLLFVVIAASGCGRIRSLITGRPSGAVRVVVQLKPLPGLPLNAATMADAEKVLENRGYGMTSVSAVTVSRKGDTFTIDIDGAKDARRARKLFETRGSLAFFHLKNVNDTDARGRNKFARWVMTLSPTGDYSFVDKTKPGSAPITDPVQIEKLVIGNTTPILTGRDLVPGKTKVSNAGNGSRVVVALTFTPAAQRKFAQFTRLNVHEFLAITLDDRILTAPRINEAILGNPIIEGNFTLAEAQQMADLLNAGELPGVPKVISATVLP